MSETTRLRQEKSAKSAIQMPVTTMPSKGTRQVEQEIVKRKTLAETMGRPKPDGLRPK